MTAVKPLITGVIGAGAISDAYLRNLTGIFSDRIQVRYVSASHIERAQKKAEQYGLTGCTNDVILHDPDVELVIILTPVASHEALIREALQAGKHVYTEKNDHPNLQRSRIPDRSGKGKRSVPRLCTGHLPWQQLCDCEKSHRRRHAWRHPFLHCFHHQKQ